MGSKIPTVFYINAENDQFIEISYALFELACRANLLFTMQKYSEDIAKNNKSPYLIISHTPLQVKNCYLLINDVPASHGTKYGSVFGNAHDDGIDVLSGSIWLLNFKFEKPLPFDCYQRKHQSLLPQHNDLVNPLLENNAEYFKSYLMNKFAYVSTVDPPWQEKTVIALTHDVDGPFLKDAFSIFRSLIYSLKGNKYEREALLSGVLCRLYGSHDPYEMFSEWTKLDSKWTSQAYYFYPGKLKNCRRHRNDPHYAIDARIISHIKELSSAGMEIGLHSGINCYDENSIVEAKYKLESITDREVVGIRSHYWSGVWPNPYSYWSNVANCGLSYDASLHPLSLGYRSGIGKPLIPSFKESRNLDKAFVVLPTPIMDADTVERNESISENSLLNVINNCSTMGFAVLDWHVRVLSNIGPWRDYINTLFRIIDIFESKSDIEYRSPSKIARDWVDHANRCFIGVRF